MDCELVETRDTFSRSKVGNAGEVCGIRFSKFNGVITSVNFKDGCRKLWNTFLKKKKMAKIRFPDPRKN